ncbi:MAG TPA: hypothetical protein VD884_21855 [Ohtaekwangia sp.]|nr:hypothetical protein [Ohtaekwangia sp.]
MTSETFQLAGKNILIISPEGWGDNLLSKHHIALTLAKLDNKVWFVSPNSVGTKSPHPNLNLISYKPVKGINRLPLTLARFATRLEVYKLLRTIKHQLDVVWSFDPHHLQFLRLFDARITIYHPVDNHYTALEQRVVDESDIIFSNAEVTLSRLSHKNKYRIGHGVASHFFEHAATVKLPGRFSTKVGYVGNLNNRLFDFELFAKLVKTHSETGFYMIGPRGSSNLASTNKPQFDWTEIDKLPNVFWLGQQSSEKIPSYLAQMDVLLILYKSDRSGFTVNSHKMLEYLSSGKLIITPANHENDKIAHLILQAKHLDEIPQVFDDALRNLPRYMTKEICEARRKYAFSLRYENRIQTVEEVLNKTLR